MEKKLAKRIKGGAGVAAVSLLALSACAEESPNVTRGEGSLEIESQATVIEPGQAVFVNSLSAGMMFDKLTDSLPLVEHHYPHGWEDNMAPYINAQPMRVDAHVYDGRDRLHNDIACDTYPIDPSSGAIHIGALVLAKDSDDRVMIIWPAEDGIPSQHIEICFADNNEPSDGVILYTTNSIE